MTYQGRRQSQGSGVADGITQSIANLQGLKDYSGEKMVKDAERLASDLRNLKTAQIRKIYGEVKLMEMDFKKDGFDRDRLVLLKPKLAYAANKKPEVRPLKDVLTGCIDKTHDEEDFSRFVNFFEAILAYHRG